MLKENEVINLIVPIFKKYDFQGKVLFLGKDKDSRNVIRLSYNLDEAKGGVMNGMKLNKEIKELLKNKV